MIKIKDNMNIDKDLEIFDIKKMSLANRDKFLDLIENEINLRKKLILNKSKKIDKKLKVNNFLEDVKQDYINYYKYIVEEKKQQYNSMLVIKQYLDDLIKSEKLANDQLYNVKLEQNKILHEMDKIKIELNKLIE
jgi:hypothetical protein